ncbi:hypothetical protein HY501_02585 [Candidatus Woesearchaeota archaeon]|nr:hypothetical protein [Candidatus Woesearchaeota archaeon]
MHILVFGDSIVYGVGDKEGGWVGRLRRYLDEKTEYFVYNLGIPGDTTNGLLERLEPETKNRLPGISGEELAIIFAIGINDAMFITRTKKLNIEAEKFRENIAELIESAGRFSAKIVFVGMTPVDESKVDPIPWHDGGSYRNMCISEFNHTIKDLCSRNEICFVDVFDSIDLGMLEDGVHPNSDGHEKIFKLVKDSLIQGKIIEKA